MPIGRRQQGKHPERIVAPAEGQISARGVDHNHAVIQRQGERRVAAKERDEGVSQVCTDIAVRAEPEQVGSATCADGRVRNRCERTSLEAVAGTHPEEFVQRLSAFVDVSIGL